MPSAFCFGKGLTKGFFCVSIIKAMKGIVCAYWMEREVGWCKALIRNAEPAPEHCGEEPHGFARYSKDECSAFALNSGGNTENFRPEPLGSGFFHRRFL